MTVHRERQHAFLCCNMLHLAVHGHHVYSRAAGHKVTLTDLGS